MRIFVTGGAGFIGSNFILQTLASRRDISVVNFDALTYAGSNENLSACASDPRYSFVRGDIRDARAVVESMSSCDAIVHFAAESHVDRSIYAPAPVIQTNVVGTFTLLEAARALRISRFVQISTDEVYGDLGAGQFADEQFPLRPSSPYAASKAAADHLVLAYQRTYGLPAVITRPSNNYGPRQFPEKFLPLMISNGLDNRPLPIYGDGLQQRNWLYVADSCAGILAVLEKGRPGEIYNLGGPEVIENVSVARKLLRLLGRTESLLTSITDRPGHDRRYALNCEKIERELGWRPSTSLDEGLRLTTNWYQENTAWVASVRNQEYRSYYEKYYENRAASLAAIVPPYPNA